MLLGVQSHFCVLLQILRCTDPDEKMRLQDRFGGKLQLVDRRVARGQNIGQTETLGKLAWEDMLKSTAAGLCITRGMHYYGRSC